MDGAGTDLHAHEGEEGGGGTSGGEGGGAGGGVEDLRARSWPPCRSRGRDGPVEERTRGC